MKLKLVAASVLVTLLSANSAFALSCVKQDLVKTLEEAKASDKVYHILVGKFVSSEPPHTVDLSGTQPKMGPKKSNGTRSLVFPSPRQTPKITQTWFEGISLGTTPQGDVPLTRFPVDVQTSCAGTWCSSPPSSKAEVVAFVEGRDQQSPILKLSPCHKWVFRNNIPVQVSNIRQCLDKNCEGVALRDPNAYTRRKAR